jgi:hypothetical protein
MTVKEMEPVLAVFPGIGSLLLSDRTMSDDLAEITVTLPVAVIDRLRGSQSRESWLKQAALELARRQLGRDPLEPVGWWELRRDLHAPPGF